MDKEDRYELLERLYRAVKTLRETPIVDDDFPINRDIVDRLLDEIGDL